MSENNKPWIELKKEVQALRVQSKSGIFQATQEELSSLKQLVSLFNFDKLEHFPDLQPDGTVIFYDKDKTKIDHKKI